MIEFGFYNMDCMDGMKEIPDEYFDLAIVDPPYGDASGAAEYDARGRLPAADRGLKYAKACNETRPSWAAAKRGRFGGRFDKYKIENVVRTGGSWSKKHQANGGIFENSITHWDIAPPQEYFDELFRVSKNQIIWGGNYFQLPPTRCFVVWRKLTISEAFSMAMVEYAWTSFNDNAKWIEIAPQGTKREPRFHPTQKPVALYEWLLNNYAKRGDKILDTHVGSASSLIACHKLGFEHLGFELDADYYAAANERLELVKAQASMFEIINDTKVEQLSVEVAE